MKNDKNVSEEQACDGGCECNKKTGLSKRIRLLFFISIVVVACAVLANSIQKKSSISPKPSSTGYTTEASLAADTGAKATSTDTKSNYVSTAKTAIKNRSFVQLTSFASLDTFANGYEGVFIVLVSKEAEVTTLVTSAIDSAIKAIGSRNIHMGRFRLAGVSPDYNEIATQMPPPCVLVLVKGKGMRGVRGNDITTTKLLQAYTAAIQPSGCCPSGSGCK